jgi:hypothetical protein
VDAESVDDVNRLVTGERAAACIPSLPLGVLVGATRGRLVPPPRFPSPTPSAHPSARVRAGEAAGVAAFADRDQSTALGTAEKSEREADHVRCRYQSPLLDRDAFAAVRDWATSVLPVALLTTQGAHVPPTHPRFDSSPPGRTMTTKGHHPGRARQIPRLYAIVDTSR